MGHRRLICCCLFLTAAATLAAPDHASAQESLPGNLEVKKLVKTENARPKASVGEGGSSLGYTGDFGAFDPDPAKPEAMFIINVKGTGPFSPDKVTFFHQEIELLVVGYKDPKSGITGDIYEAKTGGKSRYFLLGDKDFRPSRRYVIFYNADGVATFYVLAEVASK